MPISQTILTQPFREQLQYFEEKYAIPKHLLGNVSSELHDFIFTVSRIMDAELLEYFKAKILSGMREGKEYAEVIENLKQDPQQGKDIVKRFSNKQLTTILDTNYRRSQSAGRYEQLNKPHVLAVFPYRMWIHRDSPQPRPHHRELHRKVFPADDPFWDIAFPPCGFGCRCTAIGITDERVEQERLIIESPPDPLDIVDKGFESSAGSAKAKKKNNQIIKGLLSRQSPTIQRILNKERIARQ